MTRQQPDSLAAFQRWFERLQKSDPSLHAELAARLEQRSGPSKKAAGSPQDRLVEEAVADPRAPDDPVKIALETIVREGRPAFPVKQDRIAGLDFLPDASAQIVRDRLVASAAVLEPLLPLVGRIDAVNHPRNLPFLGTAWLVRPDIVVTNRHVAELMGHRDGGAFTFRPGRFGEPLSVSLDFKHELGSADAAAVRVLEILYIEPDQDKADIAFLKVEAPSYGDRRRHFDIAAEDAAPDAEVAVIGYPARAPAYIVPDQEWMDRIYGGNYDVKRIAPGLMREKSRGWATHDCTTLGGNSGSVVVDARTGNAVGLHFAGLYMIENYAVPASVIAGYLREVPWTPSVHARRRGSGEAEASAARGPAPLPPSPGTVSVTLPITITVTLGDASAATGQSDRAGPPAATIKAAAAALLGELRAAGALAVRPGHPLTADGLEDTERLIVSVHPDRVPGFPAPLRYGGWAVEVRPASVRDQLVREAPFVAEAPATIAYNDDERLGRGFSFDWVDEDMEVTCHIGPERSWAELSTFLSGVRETLVSSIYEFHAAHVADAIGARLDDGADLTLVMARQSRDPRSGELKVGEFNRAETFARWEQGHGERFRHAFVPTGTDGLCATSYHIKVSVRDGDTVWLSSGNWRRTSQPVIAQQDLSDPAATNRAGNREWHAILRSPVLAERFANHILADFEFSGSRGAVREAADADLLVDVPIAALEESFAAEGPPAEVLEPLRLSRRVRVKPLLTPDRQGDVYCAAVLELIDSARTQLVLQNQYIHASAAEGARLDELIDAIVAKASSIADCRIILRSGDGLVEDVSALKRRGFPVATKLRALSATHTKGIVVDGCRVLIGSHNWSGSGVTLNRDASLIFDDEEIAAYFLASFELDWDRARPVNLDSIPREAARLASGDRPPPGFVRMPLSEFLEG